MTKDQTFRDIVLNCRAEAAATHHALNERLCMMVLDGERDQSIRHKALDLLYSIALESNFHVRTLTTMERAVSISRTYGMDRALAHVARRIFLNGIARLTLVAPETLPVTHPLHRPHKPWQAD